MTEVIPRTRTRTLRQLKEDLQQKRLPAPTAPAPSAPQPAVPRPVKWNGSDRKSVFLIPLRVLHVLRPHLYRLVGTPWPFDYVQNTGATNLKHEEKTEGWEPIKLPNIVLRDGVCTSDQGNGVPEENLPRVLKNVKTKTSQGVIYVCSCRVDDVTGLFIQKVNLVDSRERKLWLSNDRKVWLDVFPTPDVGLIITPREPEGTRRLQIISSAFMDALCNVLLSNLVEEQVSPHFPLCYCTAVGSKEVTLMEDERGRISSVCIDKQQPPVLPKGRFTTRVNKEIIQVICLEYLPHSMYHVLTNDGDGDLWFSAFFHTLAALAMFQDRFDGVHNDCHVENWRARVVPYDTKLWYQTEDGAVFCVPTKGYVFVMIDFGRACVRPWKKIRENVWSLVSSEFGSEGALPNVAPDIKSFDVVRLVSSIENHLWRVENGEDRKALRTFFAEACTTMNGVDLLKEWNAEKLTEEKMAQLLEVVPRLQCRFAEPAELLRKHFLPRFQVSECPPTIRPFPLPLTFR